MQVRPALGHRAGLSVGAAFESLLKFGVVDGRNNHVVADQYLGTAQDSGTKLGTQATTHKSEA